MKDVTFLDSCESAHESVVASQEEDKLQSRLNGEDTVTTAAASNTAASFIAAAAARAAAATIPRKPSGVGIEENASFVGVEANEKGRSTTAGSVVEVKARSRWLRIFEQLSVVL